MRGTRRCNGKMRKTRGSKYAFCERCGQADLGAERGDLCTREAQSEDDQAEERPRKIRPPKRKHG